jgi:radical SAM family protein/4Fe-4S single cluster protein
MSAIFHNFTMAHDAVRNLAETENPLNFCVECVGGDDCVGKNLDLDAKGVEGCLCLPSEFHENEVAYYGAYMELRNFMHKEDIDSAVVLDYLKNLIGDEEDPLKKKLYMMVWAKLEEDRITENLNINAGIQKIRTLTYALTRFCNMNCKFCCTDSGADCKSETMSFDEIEEVLKSAAEAGVEIVRFCGGEFAYLQEEVLFAIKKVKELGMESNGFTTNASWVDKPWARGFLEQVSKAYDGNFTLDISVDPEHQSQVGLDKIKKFVDLYFELFPGKTLNIFSFMGQEDFVAPLLDMLESDIQGESEIDEDEENLLSKVIQHKRGAIKVFYFRLYEMGRHEMLSQKPFFGQYEQRLAMNERMDRELSPYESGTSFLTQNPKYGRGKDTARMFFHVGADGEMGLRLPYMSLRALTAGSVYQERITGAMDYIKNNPIFAALSTSTGHKLIYELAKEFDLDLEEELSQHYSLEGLMIRMLKNPIHSLAITCRLLEMYDVKDLDNLGVDFEHAYGMRQEAASEFDFTDNNVLI